MRTRNKRSLQDVYMPFLYQIGEELQEERDDKQTDVHAVHIGIGGNNHFVIAEPFDTVFDVQRRLK